MTIYSYVGFKGLKQIFKILERKVESLGRVFERHENLMLGPAGKAFAQEFTPGGEFFKPSFDSWLIGNVVGVAGKRVDRSQGVTLVAGDEQRGDREVLVMTARQAPALGVGGAYSWGLSH
jgi:hypothetical protein